MRVKKITAIIGLQWGDEGKGKVVDFLAEEYDVVVRFQGGANAGHTVVIGDKPHIFHLIPSGLLRRGKEGLIGAGVVVDPEILIEEIEMIEKISGPLEGRLFIDGRAPVVMPYHKLEDRWEEELRGGIGTTKRGIGQAYRDHYARFGIRIGDLLNAEMRRRVLKKSLEFNNQILASRYGKPPLDFSELDEKLEKFSEILSPYITDGVEYLKKKIEAGKSILFEGAQGSLLDITFGTYPYVTSSHPLSGGVPTGAGIPPNLIGNVVGITKSYTTRVGRGPFPTEMLDEEAETIRKRGNEYGATTGRPRRCGWLDLVALKYTTYLNGVTSIVMTKLDVLSGLEKVKVAIKYELHGRETDVFPYSSDELVKVRPIYRTFNGWELDESVSDKDSLPENARSFIDFVEEYLGIPIIYVSVGPEREKIIKYR